MQHFLRSFWMLALVVSSTSLCAEDRVDFVKHVRPILEKHCFRCHNADKQEGGLRLDLRASGLKGGDNYAPAILPGKSAKSPLIDFISRDDADLRMPPKGDRLSAAEIKLLSLWIDQGADWPAETDALANAGAKHWSFQPVQRSQPPQVKLAATGNANAIDAFIAEKLNAKELAHSPRADRRTLIRRLNLIMHGLPPTPEAIDAFIKDDSPDAWKKLVDAALDSPRYGERWAQHWLDLVRFGETHGFETNRERPNAWPYRDYIIRALNADKPYDQFIREQVAGDALGADVATGFLVAGPNDIVKSSDINLTLMQRQDELTDIVNTTGVTFLGLTLGCARCHNHKFDPITQRDFFALQAVFAGVQHADRNLPPTPERVSQLAAIDRRIDALVKQLEPFRSPLREPVNAQHNVERFTAQTAKYVRFTVLATNGGQPCVDELEIFSEGKNVALSKAGTRVTCSSSLPGYAIHKLEHVNDGQYGNSHSWISNESGGWVQVELPAAVPIDRVEWGRDREGKFKDRMPTRYRLECAAEPDQWKLVASSDDRQPFSDQANALASYRFDDAPASDAEQGKRWLAELEAARKEKTQINQSALAYVGTFQQPGPVHRLYRGEPSAKREEVAPDTIELLGSLKLTSATPEQERRRKLADWLTSKSNPLTARVLVNRLWQFHFGRGLVDTTNDFGRNGVAPTHPELLDWLASELMDSGWSIKHVQRLILMSHTWQQDSRPQARGIEVDGGGQLLWRFPPRRLEAEAIHDSILAVSGVLDVRMGGPGYDGFEVQYENVRHYFPKKTFGQDDYRRMVYMKKVRAEKESTFGAFDCPDASQVVARRTSSTTPLQALNLLNSDFIQHQAQLLTARLRKDAGESTAAQVKRAFQLSFGREPTPDEQTDAAQFVDQHGLLLFCRALFNANELLFVP